LTPHPPVQFGNQAENLTRSDAVGTGWVIAAFIHATTSGEEGWKGLWNLIASGEPKEGGL